MNGWRHKDLVAAIVLLVLLGVVPLLALRVDPRGYDGGRSRDMVARSQRNASAIATLLGELRTSMSDLLFVKTERYLHSGVGYVAHHEEQLLTVEAMETDVAEHQSQVGEDLYVDRAASHAGTQTLIPAGERDYRGFIGRMHRHVKPWRDPSKAHLHTDGTQLLPWFRIMTRNDPNYVPGYSIGGWWVSLHDEEASLAFMNEGVRNNPAAFQIRLARGFLLMRRLRQQGEPDPVLLENVWTDFREAVRLGLAQRPDSALGSPEEQPGWSAFQEQDLWSACQALVIVEMRYGDAASARQLAEAYFALFPENQALANLLHE
ncbi:MAG: hypothetical protein ACNA71_00515 [Kiritimatiellia bacterium]